MMINKKYLKIFLNLVLTVIAILALMSPAIINGFPLVYSDSGTYIAAAKTNSIPVDRPIVYSLFLNISSLSISLWITIFIQCLILVYLFYLLLTKVFEVKYSMVWICCLTVVLSFATSAANYSSQLMPDILAAWMPLTISILLFGKNLSTLAKVFLWIAFIISVTSHFSILVTSTVLIFIIVIYNIFSKTLRSQKNYLLILMVFASWITIPSINAVYGEEFSVSRCKNISLMARLVETGVVAEYLKEHCNDKSYSLCTYKDSLPKYGYLFAWEPTSPLYKGPCWDTGWGNCWIEKDAEYGILIHDIVTSPKYAKKLIRISLRDTYRQLIDFKIGVLVPMTEESAPYGTIKSFYPHHLVGYTNASQFKGILYFSTISKLQNIFVILSLFLIPLILILLYRQTRFNNISHFSAIVCMAIILNAAVCSSLSTVVDRYQSRIIWLLPFLLIISFAVLFQTKTKKI